jgi:hypothetical protein
MPHQAEVTLAVRKNVSEVAWDFGFYIGRGEFFSLLVFPQPAFL